MSWRKRIRGFECFESFEHENEKVQPLKNNNNKLSKGLPRNFTQNPQEAGVAGHRKNNNNNNNLLKGSLRDSTHYTQNSQNTQNLPKEEVAGPKNKRIEPAQKIPAPNPQNLGPEYDALWKKAWPLADWIDDPAAAPLADRKARLPELLLMRDRMAKIERQGGTNILEGKTPTTISDSGEIKQIKSPGIWHTWASSSTTTKDRTPDNCPAMCKRSGKCYSDAYFKGKPGKPRECELTGCRWRADS